MTADAGLTTRAALAHGVFWGQGWARHVPASAACVVTALVVHGPLTADRLAAVLDDPPPPAAGWEGPAWDVPAEVEGGADPDAADEVAGHALRARVDRFAGALGVGPVRRMGDVLALLLACGLLTELPGAPGSAGSAAGSAAPRYDLVPAPRLPAEVLPLTAGEAAREDRLRWEALHEGVAHAVLRLFDPLGGRHDRLRTTIGDLAAVLGVPADDVRAGLAVLLAGGGVSATGDVERDPGDAPFDLVMDWRRFDAEWAVVRVAAPRASGTRQDDPGRRRGRGKTGGAGAGRW